MVRMGKMVMMLAAGMILLLSPAIANASEAGAECHMVTTDLVERPDSAVGGGIWALDTLSREAIVCEIDDGVYLGTVTDVGTFVTLELDHTPAGVEQPLPAGIEGTVSGGFTTVEFESAPGFMNFTPDVLDGAVVTGDAHPSGTWVSDLFSDVDVSTLDGDSWSWTYITCSETWVNQSAAFGGNEGDITGMECPEPKPEPECEFDPSLLADDPKCVENKDEETPDPDPVETSDSEPTSTPVAASNPDTLPKTGSGTVWPVLPLLGAALILFGSGVLLVRRTGR